MTLHSATDTVTPKESITLEDIHLRAPTKDDLSFILDSWLKSNRNSDMCTFIPNDIYWKHHDTLVKNLMKRSLITMICDKEDPTHLFGYAVYENLEDVFVLHYLYVIKDFRNLGMARVTLQELYKDLYNSEILLTHIDRTRQRIVKNRDYPTRSTYEHIIHETSAFIKKREKYKLVYDPYALGGI